MGHGSGRGLALLWSLLLGQEQEQTKYNLATVPPRQLYPPLEQSSHQSLFSDQGKLPGDLVITVSIFQNNKATGNVGKL